MRLALGTESRITPHLLLRPFRRRDVDALMEAVQVSLPELVQWLPWAHERYGRSDAMAFIRESMAAWREGRAFDLCIRHPVDAGRHLGNVSVWPTTRGGQVGEIGYWVRSDETGKGLGTEATVRVAQVAYEELGMHKVILRIAEGNVGSERIAEKLGFSREGLLREELRINGVWVNHSLWGLIRHEFRANQDRYRELGWLA